MKLLYCSHCNDLVKLFREKRSCKCGKSWGYYLDDNFTTVQTDASLSIGLANNDFERAKAEFYDNQEYFSPSLSIRCWINPLSEKDVKIVAEDAPESQAPEQAEKS